MQWWTQKLGGTRRQMILGVLLLTSPVCGATLRATIQPPVTTPLAEFQCTLRQKTAEGTSPCNVHWDHGDLVFPALSQGAYVLQLEAAYRVPLTETIHVASASGGLVLHWPTAAGLDFVFPTKKAPNAIAYSLNHGPPAALRVSTTGDLTIASSVSATLWVDPLTVHTVEYQAPGYARTALALIMASGTRTAVSLSRGVTLTLKAHDDRGSLRDCTIMLTSGTNPQHSERIPLLTVPLALTGDCSATIVDLAPGRYEAVLTAPGHVPSDEMILLRENTTTTVTLQRGVPYALRVAGATEPVGIEAVMLDENHKPLFAQTRACAPNDACQFLAPTTAASLRFSADSPDWTVAGEAELPADPASGTIVLTEKPALHGSVTYDQQPVAAATVTINNTDNGDNATITTAETGQFQTRLRPGNLILHAEDAATGHRGQARVDWGGDGTDVALELHDDTSISGHVVRASDGAPVAAATLTAQEHPGAPVLATTVTADDGGFRMLLPADIASWVIATADGYGTKAIRAQPGTSAEDVTIALDAAASLRVTDLDAFGQPVPWRSIRTQEFAGGISNSALTDATGVAVFDSLPAGEVLVSEEIVTRSPGITQVQSGGKSVIATLVPGQQQAVMIGEPAEPVLITVQPARAVLLQVLASDGTGKPVPTEQDGHATVLLAPNEFAVSLWKASGWVPLGSLTFVPGGNASFTFHLPDGN